MRGMQSFDAIAADLAFLDDWDERYKYIIDLGRALPPYPEAKRDERHKVRGCASQVWLDLSIEDDALAIAGDSDAHIVKGLVALLIALYQGRRPAEALALDARAAFAPLDLDGHLTPQRSNGLAAMIRRVREMAEAAVRSDVR
ncbi:MAG: SufE family protein [Parvularculaceae bacterium]|nr:SufE family protein [Parvularculaceae bacterium]